MAGDVKLYHEIIQLIVSVVDMYQSMYFIVFCVTGADGRGCEALQ